MSEHSIVELLQQGNITVLTALLDRLLHSHRMTANLEKRDRSLQIEIVSHPRQPEWVFCVPDRQGMVAIVRRLLLVLDVQTVDRVSLSWQLLDLEQPEGSWQQVDRERYTWSTEFNLFNPKTTPETGNGDNSNVNLAIEGAPVEHTEPAKPPVTNSNLFSKPLSDRADDASGKRDRFMLAEPDRPVFPSSSVSPTDSAPVPSPVSYVIKPTTAESDRAIEPDSESGTPRNNYFGSQIVQFLTASVIMVGLFVGIHFAINANKPAKNNSSSALTNEVLL
jgi:hypothetical protein